ncbi:MAG TPA: cupredoxin domain-containing protein [Acidimicrobiales bacterium]
MFKRIEALMVTATEERIEVAGEARWSALAATALLMTAAGPLVMLAAAVGWGLSVGDELPLMLGTSAAAVVASKLVRRGTTPRRVSGVVLGLLAGMAMFWTAFGLAEPASVFDFVPGVLVLPGALLGLGAGIAAVRAQRRGDTVVAVEGGERRAIVIALAAVATLAGVSTVLTVTGRESVPDGVDVAAEIRLSDFEFPSDEIDVARGAAVLVRNNDPFAHTFTVDDLGIDVAIGPGSEKVIVIPAQAGSYILYCTPHTSDADNPSADDMATRLVVS